MSNHQHDGRKGQRNLQPLHSSIFLRLIFLDFLFSLILRVKDVFKMMNEILLARPKEREREKKKSFVELFQLLLSFSFILSFFPFLRQDMLWCQSLFKKGKTNVGMI